MADDFDVTGFLQDPDQEDYMLPLSHAVDAAAAPAERRGQPPPATEVGFQAPPPSVDVPPLFGFPPPTPSVGLRRHETPAMSNQLPGIVVNDMEPPTVRGGQHQAAPPPAAMDVVAPPAPAVMNFDQHQAAAAAAAAGVQGAGDLDGGVALWYANPEDAGGSPLYENFLLDEEEETEEDISRSIEDGVIALGGAMAELQVGHVEESSFFVPYVHGQLDCTHCCTIREVLHQSENHKTYFLVHAAYPGIFQHAIVNRFYIGPDGNENAELQYLDLRSCREEWVYKFIGKSVEALQNDKSGQVQDSLVTFYKEACARTVGPEPAPNDEAHAGVEVGTLNSILSAPAANVTASAPQASLPVPMVTASAPQASLPVPRVTASAPQASLPVPRVEAAAPEAALSVTQARANTNKDKQKAPEASLPITQAEENTSNGHAFEAAIDWATFRPVILESSLVAMEAEGESISNALLYPSMLEKQREKESKVTFEDAMKYIAKMRKEGAKEQKISSPAFRRLSRRDKMYRMHMNRITEINRKMAKLEKLIPKHSDDSSGLFVIIQKMEWFKWEKQDLYDVLEKGLQQTANTSKGAGPSGSGSKAD
ncbi:hypothetical protein ACP4OV_016021 [Aristida adscensionis]